MRYFLEVSYHGGRYAGFQVQHNALTIQEEVEKALLVLCKTAIQLTGSSRTDAGVHARQNFFHFDTELELGLKQVYSLNAILPKDIAVISLQQMPADAHCRFDAVARLYRYYLYTHKNPFYNDRAWYYPYPLDITALNNVAGLLLGRHDFTSFSKRNTQVKTMFCELSLSEWSREGDMLVYTVKANRFLRGMVRGLVATMLQVGRGKITQDEFAQVVDAKDCTKADFSAPAHGLFLERVLFPENYFVKETFSP
jgi:tRNA pseudouridine38-40 synthase